MPSHVYEAMRPYQRTGAHFLRRAGSAILADEPGLGKTIQSLGTILADATRRDQHLFWHLVVCPKVAVRNVWEPEIARWLPDHATEVLTLTGPLARRSERLRTFSPAPSTRHVFVVVNAESLRIPPTCSMRGRIVHDVANAALPELFEREWDTVICDESQRFLVKTSTTVTKTHPLTDAKVKGKVQSQVREGFMHLRSRRRLALSGTPMRGKPEQLWGTLNWLDPKAFKSYWSWAKTYWTFSSNGFSNYVLGDFKPGGKNALARSLEPYMLRRTKQEVAPELPPKTYAGYHLDPKDDKSPVGIWLDPTSNMLTQIGNFREEGVLLDHLGGGEIMVDGALANYTRARQIAGAYHTVEPSGNPDKPHFIPTLDSPKFDWLVEWLEENEGEKIVVVSQFTKLLNVFAAGLRERGYRVGLLTGETTEKNRRKVVSEFQSGEGVQVFMLNTAAGGVALTLDSADYLAFLDETSIPDDQIQAEDRIHRISRSHNVTIYYLRTLGTLDEEVAWIAAARYDVQQYLLDGARGVEYARQVYYTQKKERAHHA